MKKIITLFFVFGSLFLTAQSISFGAEVMPKINYLFGGNTEDYYADSKPQFIAVDKLKDSLGFYFTDFKKTNSIEVPIYIRFKTKKRWSFDLSYSLSKYSIEASGKTGYVGNFYEKYWPKKEYTDSLVANYYTAHNADSIYNLFIDKQKGYETGNFQYVEDIKVRSFGFNATYRFLPHKGYKPYVQLGFVYRRKVSNYNFQSLAMDNRYVNDVAKVSEAMVKFSQTMLYFRIGAGVEVYRFRLGVNLDIAGSGTSVEPYRPNNRIVHRETAAPYATAMSLGFYIGADLFNYDLASKKQNIETNTGITEIPMVKMKQDKWSLGLRVNSSVKYNLSGYYSNEVPLTIFSGLDIPNPASAAGTAYSDIYFSMLAIKNISLVDSRPQVEGFFRKNIAKRFILEGYAGYNSLKVDFATTEMKAKLTYNKQIDDYEFDKDVKNTSIYSGVFRKNYGIINFGANLMCEVVQKDLLKVRLLGGFNFNTFFSNYVAPSQTQKINSSVLGNDFDNWMEAGAPASYDDLKSGDELYIAEGKVDVDVYSSFKNFDKATSKIEFLTITNSQRLSSYKDSELFKPKQAAKTTFGSFRVGTEVEFNRILVGFHYEANLGYMQGVLLKNYSNLSLSFGYLFAKK